MKFFRFAFVAMFASLIVIPSADAKKDKEADEATEASADGDEAMEMPTIEETGIAAFDDVFGQVGAIHETLNSASTQLNDANNGIATALGLAEGTPLADALAELKDKAAGNLEIAMNGTVPSISASDAVPADVTAGIDAINAAVSDISSTISDLSGLPDQVKALVDQAKAMPAQLKDPSIIDGIPKTDLLKIPKTLKNNTKATLATGEMVTGVTSQLTGFVDTIKNFDGAAE